MYARPNGFIRAGRYTPPRTLHFVSFVPGAGLVPESWDFISSATHKNTHVLGRPLGSFAPMGRSRYPARLRVLAEVYSSTLLGRTKQKPAKPVLFCPPTRTRPDGHQAILFRVRS